MDYIYLNNENNFPNDCELFSSGFTMTTFSDIILFMNEHKDFWQILVAKP